MKRSGSDGFFQQMMEQSLNVLAQALQRQMADGLAQMMKAQVEVAGHQARAAGGTGTVSVVINNNAPVSVSARQTEDAYDRKQLEITIDQMVANALVQGRQTSGILNTLFNVAPGLVGR